MDWAYSVIETIISEQISSFSAEWFTAFAEINITDRINLLRGQAEVINTPATVLRGFIDLIADISPETKDYVEPLNKYLLQPKYDGKNLQDTIKGLLGEKLALSETLTSVIIPAFDIKEFRPTIFSTLKVIILLDFLIFSIENISEFNLHAGSRITYFPLMIFTCTCMNKLIVGQAW